MKRFNISAKIRIKRTRKPKENKNTKVCIPDLCKRDFNQTKHKNPVFSTDVSFIPATSDFIKRQNFIYFSVLFDHKTKTVMSWSLSPFNDVNLVLTHIKKTRLPENSIIHSDHGTDYSSKIFIDMIKEKHLLSSMSIVGNSLDNREVEYFFSIIKTELIYKLDLSKISFEELKRLMSNFIKFYNNRRIQGNLGDLAPLEFAKKNNITYVYQNQRYFAVKY